MKVLSKSNFLNIAQLRQDWSSFIRSLCQFVCACLWFTRSIIVLVAADEWRGSGFQTR